MVIYKGIKEVWLRGWVSGNIDDLKFAYDSRVSKATNPVPWLEDFGKAELSDSTESWIDTELSASYLVAQRDTLIFEKYWRGHGTDTLSNSFSIAKSIVAMAIGIAVDDGLIFVKDPLHKHIPRFNDGLGSTISKNLKRQEGMLDDPSFFIVHNSQIVCLIRNTSV